MKPLQGFTLRRIALATALSILAHTLLLWQFPKMEWPAPEPPQMQARLEPLPKLAAKPVPRKIPPTTGTKPIVGPVTVAAPATIVEAASSVVAETATTGVVDATGSLARAATTAEETVSSPRLPRHALLHFAVQYGGGTFKVGETSHRLENIDARYNLH